MPLNLEDKKALVKEVAEVAASSQSVVAAEYRGITVSQMTELRAKVGTAERDLRAYVSDQSTIAK